ncbi:MAG: glucose-6-phosphate isomerase [Oscillospiraceae bacterium]|nr:glucose-6-phosphate isomerase [Oscillospiraceae bacterium]
MPLKVNTEYLAPFVQKHEYEALAGSVRSAHNSLHEKSGLGSEFLGWLSLPKDYDKQEFLRIKKAARKIKNDSDVLIVIGIGGSYLGARAAIEFLKSPYYNNLKKDTPDIYFAGNNLSSVYLNELLALCEGRDFSINVVSKSGTTVEPALAFRIFREKLESKYTKEGAKNRIYCTTDRARGNLKSLSDTEGYETFVIPDNIGGRFSVLTAVGMLPAAVAGINIDAVMAGAADAMTDFESNDAKHNDCCKYAVLRNIFYNKGKQTELMACYEPRLTMMVEWYKQLFGESEGKDHKGLFPAGVVFSTDLHSLGQYIQDGSRSLFETVIDVKESPSDVFIKQDPSNFDGLNYLSEQNMSVVNRRAFEGTVLAHTRGGVPNIIIEIPKIDEQEFGYMIYFFQKSCAVSAYMLGVNPFDQPGVEDYKRNMFALLGKPGFEQLSKELGILDMQK